MKKFLSSLVGVAALLSTAAVAHDTASVPKPDAQGCTHLQDVVNYEKSQGFVFINLSAEQITIVLSALEAPDDAVARIDGATVAKYVRSKDASNDTDEEKDNYAKDFASVVFLDFYQNGCYLGTMPEPADKIGELLAGRKS